MPIKNHHNAIHGLYVDDNSLAGTEIGFVYEKDGLIGEKYYLPTFEGELKEFPQRSKTIYLPLKNTYLQRDTPQNILGIHGTEGLFPLMYFFATSANIYYTELSENLEGGVKGEIFKGDTQTNNITLEIVNQMTKRKIFQINSQMQRVKEEKPTPPQGIYVPHFISINDLKTNLDTSNWTNQKEPGKEDYIN